MKFKVDDILQDVVAAIWNYPENEVTTTQVKQKTGYKPHKIRYRFEKLEEHGYLTVNQKENGSQGIPPLVVSFTEKGRKAVREGKFGDVFSDVLDDEITITREQFVEYQDLLKRMETRLDTLQDQQEVVPQLEEKMDDTIKELNEIIPIVGGLYNAVDEMLPDDTTVEDFIDRG